MLDVCLLGCGGVMPLPDRALTSLYVRHAGKALLIDCGEGTQTSLRRSEVKHSRIDVIMFTHLHADHISGIVGLLLTFGLEGRTEPLRIYGPVGVKTAVESMRIIAQNLPFEITYTEFTEPETEFSELGLKINAFELEHSVDCIGYRIELSRLPKFDVQKAKELGVPMKLWKILQNGESAGGFTPDDVSGEKRNGITLLYATDTRPLDIIKKYGESADLMILEGMYGDPECLEKAKEAYHMTMQEAAELAKSAGAKELWLTHYSPAVKEPEIYEEEIKSIFPAARLGEDSLARTLHFED